ncbi:tyrosinase family protein [Pseudomonas poae]|uniref:tyrosinase family protein n=1 Tax=Pseudomonas poae TaxID=200451 RepID=UPI0030CF6EEC
MDIRRNHRDMTRAQKSAFIEAVLVLKNDVDSVLRPGRQKRYDDFVQIHKNSMGRGNPLIPNPHGSALFYPWHRVLIRQFELALQAATGDRSITLPYWNWQLGATDNPFTDDFMGGDGDPLQNQRVTLGPFASSRGRFDIRVWDEDEGDTGLRRNFAANPEGVLPTPAGVMAALNRTPYWSVPQGWENFSEATLHNPVHAWIGGNMGQASSSNDPVFFLHHCYLDLLWERWRQQNPTTPLFSTAQNAPSGVPGSTLTFHPDNEPAPWPQRWTVEQTFIPEGMDYAYEYL